MFLYQGKVSTFQKGNDLNRRYSLVSFYSKFFLLLNGLKSPCSHCLRHTAPEVKQTCLQFLAYSLMEKVDFMGQWTSIAGPLFIYSLHRSLKETSYEKWLVPSKENKHKLVALLFFHFNFQLMPVSPDFNQHSPKIYWLMSQATVTQSTGPQPGNWRVAGANLCMDKIENLAVGYCQAPNISVLYVDSDESIYSMKM